MQFTSSNPRQIVFDGKVVCARFVKGEFSTDDPRIIATIQRACPGIESTGTAPASGASAPKPGTLCECGAGPFGALQMAGHRKSKAHAEWVAAQNA
jgi:hypothetical protein